MDDLLRTVKFDHNRAAWGDGTGKLANVARSASTSDTTIEVDTTVHFWTGEVIDFTTSSGTVVSAAHEVVSVDRTAKTITIAPGLAAGVTAGTHFPVRASVKSTTTTPNNSLNREINGLQNIVSDSGALHGINPATYPWWKSYVKTGAGALNETLLRETKDAVGFETGIDLGGSGFAWITTRGARRRYADTLMSFRRFTEANGMKLNGGFTALEFDGDPIFVEDMCPPGNVFGLTLDQMMWINAKDWDWIDEDGNVLKQIPGRDGYVAYLYSYSNLGTTNRGAHCRLTGVTDDDR